MVIAKSLSINVGFLAITTEGCSLQASQPACEVNKNQKGTAIMQSMTLSTAGTATRKLQCLTRRHSITIITLQPTNGMRTIAQAGDVFRGFISPYFREWGLDVPSDSTPQSQVVVDKQIRDGTNIEVFRGYNTDLRHLTLSQPQIILFIRTEADNYVCKDRWTRFRFLFEVKHEFYIAHIERNTKGIYDACVSRFSRDNERSFAEDCDRVVLPQLK